MPSTKTSKIFADKLQDLLVDKKKEGKDLSTVAKELGVSTGALSNYQNDKAEIKIDALRRFADYFNVSCDYLTGKIATKFSRPFNTEEANEELGLSDDSIEHLKELHDCGVSWIVNRLFESGLYEILHEANNMYERKKRFEEAFNERYQSIDYDDRPQGYLSDDGSDEAYYWVENNQDLEREHLRKNGECVSFVLDSKGNLAEGVINIRMEVEQYLNWRFSVVGDKIRAALIEVLDGED